MSLTFINTVFLCFLSRKQLKGCTPKCSLISEQTNHYCLFVFFFPKNNNSKTNVYKEKSNKGFNYSTCRSPVRMTRGLLVCIREWSWERYRFKYKQVTFYIRIMQESTTFSCKSGQTLQKYK